MSLTVRPWRTTARAWHPKLHRWMDAGEIVPTCLCGPGLQSTPGLWLARYGNHEGGSDSPLNAAALALAHAASHTEKEA